MTTLRGVGNTIAVLLLLLFLASTSSSCGAKPCTDFDFTRAMYGEWTLDELRLNIGANAGFVRTPSYC